LHLFTLMLDILARWKTRRAISHFWLHSVVVFVDASYLFLFFFFLFDIIITNTRTQRGRKIHKNKLKVLDEKIFIANINLETLQVISLFFIFIKSFSIFLIFCDY
jgi:hypothetical protein